jgi:hypothetical protein
MMILFYAATNDVIDTWMTETNQRATVLGAI